MLRENSVAANLKLRLLKILILQVWTVYGILNDKIPKILEMPKEYIFANSRYDPVSFPVVLAPFDVRLLLLVRYSHQSMYGFHTIYNSSTDNSGTASSSLEPLMVQVTSSANERVNTLSLNVTLSNWIRITSQPIHIQVISLSGAFISPPFKIELYLLSAFEEKGEEKVEFVMGNVGQIVCEVPASKPFPPTVQFQHDSVTINVTENSKYMFVEFPPNFTRVALLIRDLMPYDSGIYRCISFLENTKLLYVSEKKTILTVTPPKINIETRFRLSSHPTLDESKNVDIKISEGSPLVLYCIFESAPILDVSWYLTKNGPTYISNSHFGIMTITNISAGNDLEVSCSSNEQVGKLFVIHVYQLPKVTIAPSSIEINDRSRNTTVTMHCQSNVKQGKDQLIQWLFNGEVANNVPNLLVKDSILIIQRLNNPNAGMYQCVIEFDIYWITALSVVQISEERIIKEPIRSRKEFQIKPGKSLKLRCQIPTDYDARNTAVYWYKRRGKKLLSRTNERYQMLLDSVKNQYILKIAHTINGQDNGTYICNILANESSRMLVETEFKVIFNRIHRPSQSTNNDHTISPSLPLFKITKPIISLPQRYLLAVNMTWTLMQHNSLANHSKIINHYRVEVKEGLPEYRPVRWRSSQPIIVWNQSIILDKFYSDSTCVIHNSHILRPQYWYSFRALGYPDIKYLQLQFSPKSNTLIDDFKSRIRSEWSDVINFEHILTEKPKIIKVTILNSTRASLRWTYSPMSDIRRYPPKQSIEFKVLYLVIPAGTYKEEWKDEYDQWFNLLYESQLQMESKNSETMKIATKVSSSASTIHQLELTSLRINTHYMISLYGILRPTYGGSRVYTPLSDISFLDTSWTTEKVTGFDQEFHNRTSSSFSYFRNKILFLVLGSLAGILFVIALSMFIMCLWYQVMYHNRKRQNLSSCSSAKTSSANAFVPIGTPSQVTNNSLFVTSSNIVSPQNLSLWYKNSHDPAEFSHLYLAQHFSLWSPNHLAQFNLPNNLHDQIIDETKSKKAASDSPTTLSTPSPKSNIDIEINNLDGSIEDSQEESVRLLDYQPHSASFRREEQCTLNNAFSVQSEGRERKDQESISDYARSISHYPFSPSALDIYSQKKRPKFCSATRKDFSSIKINLTPKTDSPTPCSPITSSFCKDTSANHYNRLKKDDTFAEHPFPTSVDIMTKNCLTNIREAPSFKQQPNYSSMKAPNNQKLSSKFLFDPIVDLNIHDDCQSNSTAASARHFSFSMYPDGVRPCINMELDQNNQTNL